MQDHEFYRKFANIILDKRLISVNVSKYGLTTMLDIYNQIKAIDDKIRNDIIEKDKLLRIAEEYFYNVENSSN